MFFVLINLNGFSQKYAPKKFYLIDSLDLSSLTKTDRQLIDSCLTLYHQAKNDTSKINALNDICENMMHDDWGKYQFFQYELINKALKTHHSNTITPSLKKSLASTLNNIGLFFDHQGDLTKSLITYHKSLKISEEIGYKQGAACSLNNIGLIFYNQGNLKNALEYYHKSLKISEEIGDKQGIAISLNNIGLFFDHQGDLPKSLDSYYKSLKISEEIGNKKDIAITLNNIGVIYSRLDNIPKTLEYHHKSLQLREEIGDKEGVTISLNNIGGIELKQNNLGTAKEYGIRSLAVAFEIGYPKTIRNAAKLLSKIYEKQNKGMQALKMYKLFVQMKDSINNEETEKVAAQQHAKYEYEKQKTIDDAEHEKQLAIEQEAQAKQKIISYATAGGLGLVVIFLIFVFNRLQVTRKQKSIIETQKQEVEQQKEVVEKAHFLLEEKNNEIIASIRYAKRIQDALLTSQKYIERNINRLKN